MTRMAHLLIVALVSITTLFACTTPIIVTDSPEVGPAAESLETTSILDDETIAFNIEEAIYTDESLKHHIHVNVYCYNGVVLLTGEIPTQEMRDNVVRHAQHVKGIKRIHNETIIAPASEFKSRRQDTWITAKVKAALLRENNINVLHIKVVTENQVVFLMGAVTREQGDIAAKVARQVTEVKQVIMLFDYTN